MASAANRRAPRFLYISDGESRSSWRAPSTSVERVAWRFVAANNRPLGRSPIAYPNLRAATRAAGLVRTAADNLVGTVAVDGINGEWRWTATLSNELVAVCVYPYTRRLECGRALRQFLVAVGEVQDEAPELRHLGPTALRVYETT